MEKIRSCIEILANNIKIYTTVQELIKNSRYTYRVIFSLYEV